MNILFALGQVVATPGALAALERADVDARALVLRHASGDFGEHGNYADITLTDEEEELGAFATSDDGKLNAWGVRHMGRILSSYTLQTDEIIWIITEQDRSATTLLLPDDY